jgi:hypothetical protein
MTDFASCRPSEGNVALCLLKHNGFVGKTNAILLTTEGVVDFLQLHSYPQKQDYFTVFSICGNSQASI